MRQAAKTLFAERGYEATTTAAIARMAGTSQSQLIKHFVDKQGVLAAIFQDAWERINPALRLALGSIASPRERMRVLRDMVLSFLEQDEALRKLMLLEARRVRGDGHMTVLVPGFLEFIGIVDGVLEEMAAGGELDPRLPPQAVRSALMGTFEGLLRDRLLAETSGFPAAYTETDMRSVFQTFLASVVRK
ncbi:MAG TPA: TetR/AcrR family transcriptional regulator [Terriglobales bacterium]|nr:TetR/AcrR family transcriptional regulator [Terriglobales bacterium]